MTELGALDEQKLEALIEVMVLAASADGEFHAEERARLERAVRALCGDGRYEGDASASLEQRLIAVEQRVAAEGRDARLTAVKVALGDAAARKVAFELALQIMAADGILRTSERELILETAEALDIDRDVAADLVSAL